MSVLLVISFLLLVTVKQIANLFKGSEVDVLRDGLHERALRIQELEVTVERLEAERPDSVNLQAAIESDKVILLSHCESIDKVSAYSTVHKALFGTT